MRMPKSGEGQDRPEGAPARPAIPGLPAIQRARTATRWRAAGLMARAYFDLSYALLSGSTAGRRFLSSATEVEEPVHGYFTTSDRDHLLGALGPGPDDLLLDLGSGIGGIALEIHRRTGARVIGVDVSPRAVLVATRRAGGDAAVTFRTGDLARPPLVGASGGYAIDSLMFVPDLGGALRGICTTLEPDARLFAILLVRGPDPAARLGRAFEAAGARVLRLEDVTAALKESSHRRAGVARALLRTRELALRSRLAMLLVVGEEALVRRAVTKGTLSRWRFLIDFP